MTSPTTTPTSARGTERQRERLLLVLAALLYLPFVFLGYGTDVDSYHVVEAGERIMEGRPYEHSREPGFLVHEVATGVLDRLGAGRWARRCCPGSSGPAAARPS